MKPTVECPRCQVTLVESDNNATALECETCRGSFLQTSELQQQVFSSAETSAPTCEAPTEATLPLLNCPVCGQPMRMLDIEGGLAGRCETCGGMWLDGPKAEAGEQAAPGPSGLSRFLLYAMSFPERTVRSTIGVAAGAAKETAEFLVPRSFQSSKTYEIVVRNSLGFLTEEIGGVAGEAKEDNAAEDFMARKAVGNFVDLAGLATLHVSPIWFMAIVSDVAYGSKTYVLELAEELKKQGLIDETSTIHHVDDVLAAVQNTSGEAASLFDTPPLSVAELKKSLENTRQAITSTDYAAILPESELTNYWREMKEISTKENVNLLGVSGALTMHSLGKLGAVSQGALTSLNVAGGLFNRNVIGHYVDSLKTVQERGFYQTVCDSSAPYVEAVWNNFAGEKETWTEEIVTGRALGKLFGKIKGWFGGGKQQPTPDQSQKEAMQKADEDEEIGG